MVVNTLSFYPVGQAFDANQRARYKALPMAESTLTLSKLEERPLDNDKNLKRLAEELHMFYLKEKMAVYKPILRMNVDIGHLITLQVLRELLYSLFHIETINVAPTSARTYLPQNELDAVYEVLFALIHSSCMQEWVEDNVSGSQKLNEGILKKLRSLKEHLIKYTTALDEVLQLYTFEHGAGPMSSEKLERIKAYKDKIKDITKRIKKNELDKLLPNSKSITPDHILCSVLGIEAECADWLERMPGEIRSHQTDMYWIERYIESKANELEAEEEEEEVAAAAAKGPGISRQFMALGFTEHRANYLEDWLEKSMRDLKDHQTLVYWAKLYIEDAFKYDILLTNVPRYPYNADRKKEWIKRDFSTEDRLWDHDEDDEEEEGKPVPSKLPVPLINLEGLKDTSYTTLNGAQFPPVSDEEHLVFFHGTDHAAARSLIEKGILFRKGKNNQDFSGVSRRGFYLSPDFEWTKSWAGCRSASHCAVVVYRVPRNLLTQFQEDRIDLYGDHERWSEIVKHCRTDGEAKLSKPMKKEYKSATFIEGPICKTAPKNFGAFFTPSGFDRGVKQTCILSEEMAMIVGDIRHIHGVLFF